MIKLNGALALLLVVCALALVTAQHKGRRLFAELAQEQDAARQIEVEWGQLQLEQSTWAMHARIEKIASSRLQMRVPTSKRIRLVSGDSGYQGVAEAAGAGRRGTAQEVAARGRIKR